MAKFGNEVKTHMEDLSEKELFRRLQLIRNIRVNFIKKYNIKQDEISYRYNQLDRLDEAEYVEVQKNNITSIRYGKYEKEKTITDYDPIKAALLNTGETQCYWGNSRTISGNFKKELGYIFIDDDLLSTDCDDEKIFRKEQEEFMEVINSIQYSLNHDLKIKRRKIKELHEEIENITCRLGALADIDNKAIKD